MKLSWIHLAFTAALALSLAVIPTTAQACDLFDGCPDGGFVLECGCVLCLPGYQHTATGDTSNSGYDCYTCAPIRGQAQHEPVRNKCYSPHQPAQPVPLATLLGLEDLREELPVQD